MRQWMCDPEILCDNHLLGEHCEHHMFMGAIKKGTSMRGYLLNNLLEPTSLKNRHDEISSEMTSRGMDHKTPFNKNNDSVIIEKLSIDHLNWKIDKSIALNDLLSRCPKCKERYDKMNSVKEICNAE